MAAELPMNITISMGDVSFSLTPMSDDQFSLSSSDFRSPSPQKSQRRSSSRQDANHRASPPILSIRQGTSTSPSTPHRSIRRSSFASKGHVREMKENIELQQRGQQRRSSGFSSSRADECNSIGYSVDLHQFTGTLQIIPSKQNNEQNAVSCTPPRKRRQTKKRNSSSLVVNSINRKQNNEAAEMLDESTIKKSVQFSLPKEKHNIGKNSLNNNKVAEESEIEHLHSPLQEKEKPSIAKSILSPPLSVLASPPQKVVQATAKIARGTSSALARSSKLAFKQIADAYDMLHDSIITPPNYAAHINELSHSSFDSIENEYDAIDGTEYHYACASDNVGKIRTLIDGIEGDELFYLWKTDCNGKLPLHVISENSQLIEKYPMECEDVTMSMIELMGPANLVYALHPKSNWAPFINIIGKWTEKLHRTTSGITSSSVRDTTKSNRLQIYLPNNVRLTHHVMWAICLLSRLLDEYPEETREFILTNLATVPLFLKSVLLCGDSSLLETSLVKHAALDKRSINVWLIALLTSNRESRFQAVTFITLLSRLTLVDLVNSSERFSDKEIERFLLRREETFKCMSNLPGFFPACLALGEGLENLSTSRVLRYVTASTIRKSISFFVLLLDFFYSIFLLMGYRLHVEFALSYDSVNGPENYATYKFLSIPMNFISGYFLLKEGITVLSLYLTSHTLARGYCTQVGNILDVASVVMVLSFGATLLHNAALLQNQGFLASLTMMLLWLRIINAYKIMNSSFALFIYSVKEVIRKVKWFLLFILAIVFMFSDAVRAVVAARGDCLTGNTEDPYIQEFCDDGFIATTVRMYSVLVGDVSLEYFQSSDAMVTVFVFFSFFSIIILFNILIAIIISAYESTRERTREIFGRTRVEYAAHLIARKQFMSSTMDESDYSIDIFVPRWVRKCVRAAYFVISVCALFAVEYGFAGAVFYLHLEKDNHNNMIHHLMLVYSSIGALFNVYIISVGVTTLFSKYEKLSPKKPADGTCCLKLMALLNKSIEKFHHMLGFNEDLALDLSDDINEMKYLGSQ